MSLMKMSTIMVETTITIMMTTIVEIMTNEIRRCFYYLVIIQYHITCVAFER